MTHAPETGTINQLHFSSSSFWNVRHANLGPDSSGTRFRCRLEHCSTSSQKVVRTWLRSLNNSKPVDSSPQRSSSTFLVNPIHITATYVQAVLDVQHGPKNYFLIIAINTSTTNQLS